MNQDWKPHTPIPQLEEYCLLIGLGKRARLFLRPELTARQYLGRLLVHGQYPDAIRFQAHTLPKREAVWWACLCLRSVSDPMRLPKQAEALKAVVRWVMEPGETNRQAAGAAGKDAGFATPVGCIAMAVFWSGGSILPPNQPVVPPDPLLTANTLSGTIMAAAAEGLPEQVKPNMRRFLALGIGIAKCDHLWASPEKDNERLRTGGRNP